jgi:transcriptional regulator with XRE-family HTH domain
LPLSVEAGFHYDRISSRNLFNLLHRDVTGQHQMRAGRSHIEILRSELERRKKLNPRYSLRSFARNLRIDPSALSRVLHGKQPVSPVGAKKLLELLRLEGDEADEFLESILRDHGERMRKVLYPRSTEAIRPVGGDGTSPPGAFSALSQGSASEIQSLVLPVLGSLADWISLHFLSMDGLIQRAMTLHRRAEPVRALLALEARYPPDPDARHGIARTLRTAECEVLREIPDAMLEDDFRNVRYDNECLRFYVDHRLRSQMSLPLRRDRKLVGALTFSRVGSAEGYRDADLRAALGLVERAELLLGRASTAQEA